LQKGYAKKSIIINIAIIFVYSFIWGYTRPPEPPKRIVVLPSVMAGQNFELNSQSLQLTTLFQANEYNLDGRFLVHHWQWMYETLGHKVGDYQNWLELAKKFKPYILIESRLDQQNKLSVTITPADSDIASTKVLTDPKQLSEIFEALQTYKIKIKEELKSLPGKKYIECQVFIKQDKLDQAYKLVENDSSKEANLLKAAVWVERGLQFKYDQEKLKFVDIVNPSFEKAKALLYPFIRSRNDPPLVTYLLGRMAIREQQFENAEIFLKKAFIDQPRNPRIYYLLSFLLPSRLEELGFDNRKEILKKTVELDPGYADAVFDLANEYYITGTGAVQGAGTKSAMYEMEKYLYLNDEHPKIMSLLATLYLKTSQFDKAEQIYNTLARRYPEDSNAVYNLGVVFYTRGEYKEALEKFMEAIKIDKNLDAYLYAGMTYERIGNKEQALKYYQDRVRYKKTGDDPYAREAMHGIRKLREEMGLNNHAQDH
jgi:tetratricopeptide (TPR) repeat protein